MKNKQSLLLLAVLMGLAANLNMAPADASASAGMFAMHEAYSTGLTHESETVKVAEAGKCGKGSCSAAMKAGKKDPKAKCAKAKCSKSKCAKAKCSKAKCAKAKCSKTKAH